MESETDTEEYEKVSQTPSESQNNNENINETASNVNRAEFGTSTDEIETKNIETMTEVRIQLNYKRKKKFQNFLFDDIFFCCSMFIHV